MRTFEELEKVMVEFAIKRDEIHTHVNDRYTDRFFTLFVDKDWKEFTDSLTHEEIILLAKSKTFRARILVADYPKNDDVLELLLADPDEKVRKVTRENQEKTEELKQEAFKKNKERY